MLSQGYPFVIIETGAPQATIIEFESQRMNQVQLTAGIRTQADHVARVRRYLWLMEHDMKHWAVFTPLADTA
jgi:hypothetical protein